MFMWTDAIERGPEMTALRDGVRGKDKPDVPIKMIWNYAGNRLINQHILKSTVPMKSFRMIRSAS
ncbi:hypothetical protein ACNKHP_23880 [Shigella boydii]